MFLSSKCTKLKISKKTHNYRPHPKDGEGNIFSLCVSSHLDGGRGGGTPSQVQVEGPGEGQGGGGRWYVSYVHAGGLSCLACIFCFADDWISIFLNLPVTQKITCRNIFCFRAPH